MPDLFTRYEITDDGEVVNPPIIARYEQQIAEAAAAADQSQIDQATEDYAKARRDIAERHNKKVNAREQEDNRLLAEADEQRRREQEAQQDAAAQTARREEAERLRQQQNPGGGFVGSRPPAVPTPQGAGDPAPATPSSGDGKNGPQGGGER